MRVLVAGTLVLSAAASAAAQVPDLSKLETTLTRIAKASRDKMGVALIHLESGRHVAIRGGDRFPMASVVKLPIAIELLAQASTGVVSLDRQIWIGPSDVRPCCTLSRRYPNGGVSKSALEMLELMMIESDNTAADAVLTLVGGAAVVERRMRTLGFTHINVNRSEGQLLLDMVGVTGAPPADQWTLELQRRLVAEMRKPALNEGRATFLRDQRDTATPWEMGLLLGRLQLGNLLPRKETDLLLGLMKRSTTGAQRLRARLPPETLIAHKTGTTAVVINDVGIITLPSDSMISGHVVLAVFVADGSRVAAMERAIAQVSAAAFEFFTGKPLPQPVRRRPVRRR